MLQTSDQTVAATARTPFTLRFLPLAMEFVGNAARGFGYGDRETAGLVLAVEELYAYYASQAGHGGMVDLTIEDGGYRLLLTLSFQMANPDMRAFNLTFNVDLDSEDSLAMLGPMIAARSVTGLRLEFGPEERVKLILSREREYPPFPAAALPPCHRRGEARLTEPSPEDMQFFSSLISSYNPDFTPAFLFRSGMAADMLVAGELSAILAQEGNTVVGGIVWRRLTDSCIEVFGPYLPYDQPDGDLMSLLLDETVTRISRTNTRGLLRRQGVVPLHERFFDYLGELSFTAQDGATTVCTCYYRQLREESGGVVYCQKRCASFLTSEYERLCLPRQVRETEFQGHRPRDASVMAVEFELNRSLATIRPLCAGRDMAENLAAHQDLLRREGVRNIVVELDTGVTEQMMFASPLYDAGFLPRLLIPDAGLGDLLIFTHPGNP